MANNFQIANRAFQESFQRARALDLQRQREERFDRQLQVNSQFRQADLNIQRERVDLERKRFERGTPSRFQAINTGATKSVFDPSTGEISPTAFASTKVAGETGGALPGRFAVAATLKESGITGTALTAATENIPLDLNRGEAEGFLLGSEAAPFFQQEGRFTFGAGKGFRARIGRPNVSKEEVEPELKEFLQKTNFATSTPDQQTGILRAFEESLGISFEDGDTAVPRDEVEFDLKSEFFSKIVEVEKIKPIKVRNAKGEIGTVPANQLQDAIEQGLTPVE